MPDALVWPGLILLGLVVGAAGTLVGVGGGFLLVPLLLLLYPDDSPEVLTSISLAVVFVSAASGSFAYARRGRVDYLAGNTFALATLPGAVAGALLVGLVPRSLFDVMFAVLLLAVAVYLVARPAPRVVTRVDRRGEVPRMLTDRSGDTFAYSFSMPKGIGISAAAGFVSSLLGIGGGIIHVPAMVQVLRFPAHVATATSQYVLMFTALTGTIVHLLDGTLDGVWGRIGALAVGVLLGAQIGAHLSTRVSGTTIVRLLGVAMAASALRLLVAAVTA